MLSRLFSCYLMEVFFSFTLHCCVAHVAALSEHYQSLRLRVVSVCVRSEEVMHVSFMQC